MAIGILHVHCAIRMGGWRKTDKGELQTEMVNLAREQLSSSGDFSSSPIIVLSFETQVVQGTNARLIFLVNCKQKCTMMAFKPLPNTEESVKVQTFDCEDVEVISGQSEFSTMSADEYLL